MRLGIEAGGDTLDLANELNIRGVPIDGNALVEQGVEATLAPLRDRGLEACQIGAFGYNPLSDDRTAAAAESEKLSKIIELAPGTGCRHIVIGPGNYHPSGFGHYDRRNFTSEAIDALAEVLRPMVALAEQHNVQLCIEPYLKGVICGAKPFQRLHEAIGSDALQCNVDPTSLYDFHTAISPARLIRESCEGLAGHIGLVHVKEIAVREGFHLQMGLAPLADGHTDWALLLELIAPHLPEDSWVILEHILSPEQGREDYRILMDAADRAGVALA
jgi:sugar phosphate isomerase/epimerase